MRRPGFKALWLLAGYALVCLIWGTNWLAIKVAVTDMPPMLASGLRFLVAAPILLAVCRLAKQPILYRRPQLPFATFVTLCYFTIPYLLLNAAEQRISSGLTAVCFSMIAILIPLLSVPILGSAIGPVEWLGVVLAVSGLVVLITTLDEVNASSAGAVAAALTAAAMHALSYVLIKKHGVQVHPLTLNALPALVAGCLLVGASAVVERPGHEAFTPQSVLATVHLAVVASVIGLVVYFALLQRLSALTMSFVFVVFPLIAEVLSQLTGGNRLELVQIGLICLIGLGMGLTLSAQQRRSDKRRDSGRGSEPPLPWVPGQDQLDIIYSDAARRYPEEACGFSTSSKVVPCENQLATVVGRSRSPSLRDAGTGYAFSSADIFQIAETLDGDDPAVLIYHSHPDVGAYMSDEDQIHAVVDGQPAFPVLHLVVDATSEGVRGSKLFEFSSIEAKYVEVATFGAPVPSDPAAPR